MVLWSQVGPYSESPSTLSSIYFRQGYAIAAGLGFVVGEGEANAFLSDLQNRVNRGEVVAKPGLLEVAPPGIYADTLHPPGMSLLVAATHRLFQIPADVPLQLVGAILDSLAAGLVYWIGWRLLGHRAAVVAGLLYALFLPQAWAVTGAQMPDGLIGPFIVAMAASYLVAIDSVGWRSARWFMLAGVTLGLGSYLRPDYLLVPLALMPFLWLYSRRFSFAIVGSMIVVTVAFVVLLPWAYRNHNVYDRWIFTSSGAGATLITGLGEFSNPWGIGSTDEHRQEEALSNGFRSAWVPEADAHFRRVWWGAVRDAPGAFLLTMVKRLPLGLAPPLSFGYKNPAKTQTFTELRGAGEDRYQALVDKPSYIVAAYWDVLAMAAFSGLALLASIWWMASDRRRWRLILLLLSIHFYSVGVHLLIHIEPRFLLPSMFVLLFGLAWVLTKPRPRTAKQKHSINHRASSVHAQHSDEGTCSRVSRALE